MERIHHFGDDALPTIELNGNERLSEDQERRIKAQIIRRGFSVLRNGRPSAEFLLRVAAAFGHVQTHVRANAHGIVGDGDSVDQNWKRYRDEYRGVSSSDFSPHTDGSFLDGVVVAGKELKLVGPPMMMLLQCVRQAEHGGANIIVDGQAVLKNMLREHPEIALTLMRPGCITIARDDQVSLHAPVFEQVSGLGYRLRFRFDETVYAPQWAIEAIRFLQEKYSTNPCYRRRVTLSPGDILIADNFRVLHGRESYPDNEIRKWRRVWIADPDAGALENLSNSIGSPRVFSRFDNYCVLTHSDAGSEIRFRTAGVRLTLEEQRLVGALQDRMAA